MKSTLIREELKPFFSFWKPANIIITDLEYNDISADELREEIISIPADGDCDDYARELWCYLRHRHPQWPIGMCLLSKVAGIKTNHSMIIGSCTDGIYLIEPQAVFDIGLAGLQRMWKAHPTEDRFYFTYI